MDKMSNDRDVALLKNRLDTLAELLFCCSHLSKALFKPQAGADRTTYYNFYKLIVDVERYVAGDFTENGLSTASRDATIQRVLTDETSSFHHVFSSFARWRQHHYEPALLEPQLLIDACHGVFLRIHAFSAIIRKSLTIFENDETRVDTITRADHTGFDIVHASEMTTAPAHLYQAMLGINDNAAVKCVWPSYYHCYVVLSDDCDLGSLQSAINAIKVLIGTYENDLPYHCGFHRFPILIPENTLAPLLYCCYLNKPFKYDDFMHERIYVHNAAFTKQLRRAPDDLQQAMALEAVSHSSLKIRMDPGNLTSSYQAYRIIAGILRLEIFFKTGKIVTPLSAATEIYEDVFPAKRAWAATIRNACLTTRITDSRALEEIYYMAYPTVKTILDDRLLSFTSRQPVTP